MKIEIVVFCLLLSQVLSLEAVCTVSSSGIVANKQSDFQHQLNRLRSAVATGSSKNHQGQFVKAANMHFTTWSQGIANQAQSCANQCPQYDGACQSLQGNYGMVSYWNTIPSVSADWQPQIIINSMMSRSDSSKQLLWGQAKQFGCGRSVTQSSGTTVQYIVCFFDQKTKSGFDAYTPGGNIAGGACQVGTVSGYTGLCASGFQRSLVAQEHKIHHHRKSKNHRKHSKKGKNAHKKHH